MHAGDPCDLDPYPCNEDTDACMVDMVPDMTDYAAPSGLVENSTIYSATYPGWQVFDVDPSGNSMWISDSASFPQWVSYEFTVATQIYAYVVHYSNGGIIDRAPRDFTFEGWNGVSWVILDTRPNETGWTGNEARLYMIATPSSYIAYRLYINDVNGSVVVAIGDLVLLY